MSVSMSVILPVQNGVKVSQVMSSAKNSATFILTLPMARAAMGKILFQSGYVSCQNKPSTPCVLDSPSLKNTTPAMPHRVEASLASLLQLKGKRAKSVAKEVCGLLKTKRRQNFRSQITRAIKEWCRLGCMTAREPATRNRSQAEVRNCRASLNAVLI